MRSRHNTSGGRGWRRPRRSPGEWTPPHQQATGVSLRSSPGLPIIVPLAIAVFLTLPIRASAAPADGPIKVPVLVTLIDQVEVSAREAGALSTIDVQEGQLVTEGASLARQEDSQPVLALQKAQVELQIAAKQAASDVKARYAKKSAEVATVELERGLESVQKFKNSVSQSEIDQLRLMKERAALEFEQAKEDQEVAEMTVKLKQNAVDLAANSADRRRIAAPIPGMVVQIKRHKGEWVQPGDPIVRIVRLDHLQAEAFLSARDAPAQLVGRAVKLLVDLPGSPHTEFPGKLVFVNPEVNPVNGQFRVKAEIENRNQLLRPGLPGTMVIAGDAEASRESGDGRRE